MKLSKLLVRRNPNMVTKLLHKVVLAVSIFLLPLSANAQQVKDSTKLGEIKGVVQDSAYNYVLSNATVAIYKDVDSSLLQFSIPNNFGEFSIKSLPVENMLRLIITHVGYKPLFKKFSIPKSTLSYDFGTINMFPKSEKDSGSLSEVVITAIAPMQMNGDTLEFNADAFKLDSNATAEDLMRRLPGFMVWGDGDITYNGKEINSILVNGKPFMGGDFSVITQNISKNSVDKVQLYQQKNEQNPLDSTLNANLKLKKNVDQGHFGKISGGIGTEKRYAADGMFGIFNKKLQLTVVGATNNINKVANDVGVLVKNSTFKGVGANIDYQPDFNMQGLNKSTAVGATFQYDFLPDVNYYNVNRLNADYFLKRNDALVVRNTISNTLLGMDSVLTQNSSNTSSTISTNQRASSKYERNTQRFRLTLNSSYAYNDSKSANQSLVEQERTGFGLVSTSTSSNESTSITRNYNMGVDYSKKDPDQYKKDKRFVNNYDIRYELGISNNDGSNKRNVRFQSAANPLLNSDYSRYYQDQDALTINNHLYVGYPNLKKLLFGKLRLANIQMELATDVYFNNNTYNDRVMDLDTLTHQYKINSYLTNERDLDIVNIQPTINISKTFWKQLSNRYSKYVSLGANAKMQYYSFDHNATQSVQNINYQYNKFIPVFYVNYQNSQYSVFDYYLNLRYYSNIRYPDVNQLAPLIDSSNVLSIPMGNLNLKPQREQHINLNYSFTSRKKNPLIWNLNLDAGKTDNYITDSTLYDNYGRRTLYHVNSGENKFLTGNGSIKKSYQKGKNNTYQIGLQSNFSFYKNPNYINSTYNISNTQSSTTKANLDYTFKDVFALKLQESLSFYNTVQKGFDDNEFKSRTIATMVSGSLQMPKNLNWSTNITFNNAKARDLESANFAIWNASLTYRFLKGNRGEAKFSALDLLHQNKSIVNTVSGNTQSFSYVNVLQQYFMFTLSYFPRKFGK